MFGIELLVSIEPSDVTTTNTPSLVFTFNVDNSQKATALTKILLTLAPNEEEKKFRETQLFQLT